MPLPPSAKSPPPKGFTGRAGHRASGPDCQTWQDSGRFDGHAVGNLALRPAPDVLALDIDHYDGKTGLDTVKALAVELGVALPATFVSTARPGTGSGIYWFRVPGDVGGWHDLNGVDMIHPGHRYAVAPPSIHPDLGTEYRWLDPTGREITTPPNADDLPCLPGEWVEHLRRDATAAKTDLDTAGVADVVSGFPPTGPDLKPCDHVVNTLAELTTKPAYRHNTYRDQILALMGAGRRGCPGVPDALNRVRVWFMADVAGDRSPDEARAEWGRMVTGAAALVVSEPQGSDCPRDFGGLIAPAAPAPAAKTDLDGSDAMPVAYLAQGRTLNVPVGRRFADGHLRRRWLHVEKFGWHRWDGTRWNPDNQDRVMGEAATWLQNWLAAMVKDGTDDSVIKPCLRYRDIGNVRQVVTAARTDPEILAAADTMDNAPGLLNCRNGTVDLRTGELLGHNPDHRITKRTAAGYVPGATHPDWDKALSALPGEVADWLKIVIGAAATGEHDRDDPVTFHHGHGSNGKSLLLGATLAALGDYGTLVPDQLLAGRGSDHPTYLMPLRGARFALLEELPEDHVLPLARIKSITGTPVLTARLIGQNFVTWRPTHTLAVSTNYLPVVSETDHGTWRRLIMVDYPRTFGPSDSDATLKRRLRNRAQQEAILSWIATGAKEWYSRGCLLPAAPPAVAKITEVWREESDPLAQWLRSGIKPTGKREDRISTIDLHGDFTKAQPVSAKPWGIRTFSQRLKAHRIVASDYLGVNRGPRNDLPTALVGAAWKDLAQGAQGQVGSSREGNPLTNDRLDPAHPAHDLGAGGDRDPSRRLPGLETDPASIGPCAICGAETRRYGDDSTGPLCDACQAVAGPLPGNGHVGVGAYLDGLG